MLFVVTRIAIESPRIYSMLRRLLQDLIDYAGLFPPAGLPMPQVVSNYQSYLNSRSSWMLARLIIPTSRLDEFASNYMEQLGIQSNDHEWLISALIPAITSDNNAFQSALESIKTFNEQNPFAAVDTIEGSVDAPDHITSTLERIPATISAFIEIPFQNPDSFIAELAKVGRPKSFAKIRTGGVSSDLIPPADRVANFLCQCAKSGIGLKATAGLHHPIRAEYPLTYDADAPNGTMHGFVNVFLAACFAYTQDWTPADLQPLLEETDSDAFQLHDKSFQWRGNSVSDQQVVATREHFAISFGSCSFDEPIEDLVELGWLETTAKTV